MIVGEAIDRLGRGARRIGRAARRRPATVAAAVMVGIVAVAVGLSGRTGESDPGGSMPSVRIGVSDGDSVPEYVTRQQGELAQLATRAPASPVYAMVSFAAYLSPREVAGKVDIVDTPDTAAGPTSDPVDHLVTIAGYARVPLPGQQTELVRLPANRLPDDLVTGMLEVADRKAAQADADLAPPSGVPIPRRSIAAVAAQEAAAYRSACSCVYALVVRATPDKLTALAGREGVRVVDPAPELAEIAYGVFVAPLPEQFDTVGPLPQAEG